MKRIRILIGMAGISLAMAFALTSCDDVLAEIRKGLGAADAATSKNFAEVVTQMAEDAKAGIPFATYTLPGNGEGESYLDDLNLIPSVTCPAVVTIDGGNYGGWNVTGKGSIDGIVVGQGMTLTLTRITFKNLKFTADGKLVLEDGATLRDNGGSGVTVRPNGILQMWTGSLVTANNYSGVLLWASGESELPPNFLMTGGTISGNYCAQGGGVRMEGQGSVFTMSGGLISGNTGGSNGGGGVGLYGADTVFTMNGGEISGNTANNGGGGVRIAGSNAKFTMSNGLISGNSSNYSGGVLVIGSESEFTMNGGEISGNTAGNAGGVGVGDFISTTFKMTGGVIRNNTASSLGGGVYIRPGSAFDMTAGEISGNSASSGGGVFAASTFTGNPQIGGTTAPTGKGWIHGNEPEDVYYW
jgi:hypothetical protein